MQDKESGASRRDGEWSWSSTIQKLQAYGEAKSEGNDTRMKAVDLARLAVFGKDSIDVHYLNRVVLFQIIGEHSKKLTELITSLNFSFQERR